MDSDRFDGAIGEHGLSLDGPLRERGSDLVAILNGLDESADPATDPALPAHYGAGDLAGRALCKAALRRPKPTEPRGPDAAPRPAMMAPAEPMMSEPVPIPTIADAGPRSDDTSPAAPH